MLIKEMIDAAFKTGNFKCPNLGKTYKAVVFNNGWGRCKIVNPNYTGQVLASDEDRLAGYFLFKLGKYTYPCCYNDIRIIKLI